MKYCIFIWKNYAKKNNLLISLVMAEAAWNGRKYVVHKTRTREKKLGGQQDWLHSDPKCYENNMT